MELKKNLLRYNVFWYDSLICLLVFFIPLSTSIPNILLAVCGVFFIAKITKKDLSLFQKRLFWLLLAILTFLLINSFFGKFSNFDIKLLSRLSLVVVLPVLLWKVQRTRLIKETMIISIHVTSMISLYSILVFYFNSDSFSFANSSNVSTILFIERPYLGFLCVLNSILSLEVFGISKKKVKYFLFWNILVSITLVLLISARLALISMIIVMIIWLLNTKNSRYSNKVILILFSTILTVALIFNKNISERFFIEDTIEKSLNKIAVYEPRVVIWKCSKIIFSESNLNPIVGFQSFEKTRENLVDCYSYTIKNPSKRKYYLNEKFNTHNQFIDFLISHGIIGAFLIISFFVYSFYSNRKNLYSFLNILVFLQFFFVENVLHRQLGCYLFGVSIYLYFLLKNSTIENEGKFLKN